ncbi:hypothetical protein SS1G_05894 [Sclerotinia sclerotiorum 1980 UF-70]|uniref:DUF1776-domain-containing protein n=2 Tax=Sclerotinia sclerotiorum (strain ATCC 18683 / 1980 / Ss-1) TaxID=665079 RepID=A0A1D9Q5M5_SCLS1|nr:hypothetical protein SS1G_05894 [Sclerotinia sclerotiorum 1980 UF-70]APA09873.1 hypothetical protein sscle_05g046430 [Sclerotinia sclerotiorum 1980 UF-70]EDO03413.1 hypothetical protein SS1G_05894 [Sclerotinia sclerotiorum 1980 UF-70]
MSADDQVFLDILSSVPNDIKKYSNDVADYIERHIEKVAASIRVSLASAEWIPPSARPRPPPPTRTFAAPQSVYIRIEQWVSKNKLLTGAIVIVVGGITYHVIRKRSNYRKKRRAKRAVTGARQEVVVLAGSPSEPITRSISLDLERRGFIVYVVCNTIEDEVLVQNESRQDIKPLMIDIVDPSSASAAIDRFAAHLRAPHSPFQGGKTHHLIFRSLILIPSLTYPSSPIATLSASTLSDLLNTRLLNPILTLQNFLPLLTQLPFHGSCSSDNVPKPSILVLTPNIIPSLSPAFHAPESSTTSFLKTFTQILTSELSPLSIPVTNLQLGTFDFSFFGPKNQLQSYRGRSPPANSNWDPTSRHVYSRNYAAINCSNVGIAMGCGSIGGGHGKGSSLRELNNAVFDAMERKKGGIIRVGMGSSVYGFIGAWVPRGLVAWMMGVRKFKAESAEDDSHAYVPGSSSSSTSSSEGKAFTPESSETSGGTGLAGSEYISINDMGSN